MDELAPPTRSEEFLERSLPLMWGQTPLNILLRAFWVLRDRRRWVNFAYAVDEDWNEVHVTDPTAVRYSLEGAVAMASNPYGLLPPYFMKLLDEVIMELYGEDGGVGCLEEYCGHRTVLLVLKRAIERVG